MSSEIYYAKKKCQYSKWNETWHILTESVQSAYLPAQGQARVWLFHTVGILGVASPHFAVYDVQRSCIPACVHSHRSPTLTSTPGVSCGLGRPGNSAGFGWLKIPLGARLSWFVFSLHKWVSDSTSAGLSGPLCPCHRRLMFRDSILAWTALVSNAPVLYIL